MRVSSSLQQLAKLKAQYIEQRVLHESGVNISWFAYEDAVQALLTEQKEYVDRVEELEHKLMMRSEMSCEEQQLTKEVIQLGYTRIAEVDAKLNNIVKPPVPQPYEHTPIARLLLRRIKEVQKQIKKEQNEIFRL